MKKSKGYCDHGMNPSECAVCDMRNSKATKVLVVDYRKTEIGRQNWEVCARMLVHDLLDLSKKDKRVKDLLEYYSIGYLPDGGYTMALPRMMLQCR